MRFGITFKLFAVILATCIVVTLSMGAAVRYSFESGFRDYVRERETRRATELSSSLAQMYRDRGSWEELRENPSLWGRALRAATSRYAAERERERQARDLERQEKEAAERAREEAAKGTPPGTTGPAARRVNELRREREAAPPPPAPPPYSLIDTEEKLVAGAPVEGRDGAIRRPVDVDGQTVGWLLQFPPARSPDDNDNRFQERQENATWVIVGLSALLAALVSILLARIFLAPVRRLASATQRLAAGDYATRVRTGAQDELGQLAEDFNRLANTLEKNEQLRRNLVADISHELRTPLAVLRAEIEALEDGIRPLTPDTLASLQSEVAMLNKLIDDLHELSLADEGALTYRMTDVDLAGLLEVAAHGFRERYRQKNLRLDTEVSPRLPQLRGDPQRLRQLLNNLLENSLRYTDEGGLVRVSLSSDNQGTRLDVRDSSPGVAEELLPRLFERLFRVDGSRNREAGGTGLGLAICQRIVEAHGGSITARPSPLGGVWMAITFPHS